MFGERSNPNPSRTSALRRAASMLGALAIASSGAALAAPGEITFQTEGIGVEGATTGGQVPNQINHDVLGLTEALSVDFGAEAVTAIVEVSNLFADEFSGERGQWEAFDGFGQPAGQGIIQLTGDQDMGTVTISSEGPASNTSGPFRYLVFTSLPFEFPPSDNDSSDYFVRSITYTLDAPGAGEVIVGGPDAGADDWAPLNPTGFALGAPYLENGVFIGAEPIVVNTQECSGDGEDNLGCVVPLADELTLVVQNSPDVNGSFTAGAQTIIDPRASCGNDVVNSPQATLDLGFPLDDQGTTGPIIPAHLCGTPNSEFGGQPTFELINVNGQLTVITSVLELIADNDTNDLYNCLAEEKSLRPVVTWLPKTSNEEIPVLDAQGNLVTEFQDVTIACGSTRGRTSRFSFVAYDLRHIENAPYVDITQSAIDQLNATVQQSSACVSRPKNKAVVSRTKAGTNAFKTRRYSVAKREFLFLLDTVSNDVAYEQCLFDLDNQLVFVGDPQAPGDGNLPRNFRGDLIVQIQHILYMIDRMLDEPKPALPEF